MAGYVELWGRRGREVVQLTGERVTVGKASDHDVALPDDSTVSRLHAVLERIASGWCIRDLGSRNGTFVNGERVWGDRALRPGDEILVGRTRLVYQDAGGNVDATRTQETGAPPAVTPRERDVLVALCRPVLGGDLFTEPASIKEIAAALVVTETAVKQHLVRLYDKFGLHEGGTSRRLRLANEAVRRGAVTLADLKDRG